MVDEAGESLLDQPASHSRRWIKLALGGVLVVTVAVIVITVIVASGGSDERQQAVASTASSSVAASASQPAAPTLPPPPPPPPPPTLPEWIEIRVQRVNATPGREWDGPSEERGQKDQCRSLADVAKVVPKVGFGISILCELFTTNAQRQTDPRQPDLQLLLETTGVQYRSYIAFDQQSQLFDYPFMIPSSALTDDGLVLTVVDNDQGAERGEEIGSVRLSKQWLLEAWLSGRLQSPAIDGLSLIEIAVSARRGDLIHQDAVFDAREGGRQLAALEVVAGDFIRIKATGVWQIGNWNDTPLGALGYTDGRLRDSNLQRFRDDAHGGLVALVGRSGMLFEVPPTTCFRAVAPYSGIVWVGLNDSKPSDNSGTVSVRVHRRGPKPEEWRQPSSTFPCE